MPLTRENPLATRQWKGAKGNCILGQTKQWYASSQLCAKDPREDYQSWRFINN